MSNKNLARKKLKEKKIEYNISEFLTCVEDGNIEVAKLFIEAGIDINYNGGWGDVPILYAIQSNNIEMIEFLLKSGAKINFSPGEGAVLNHAICDINRAESIKEYYQLINLVLSKGAKVNNEHLIIASEVSTPEIIKLLLSYDLNINTIDNKGNSSLMQASYYRIPYNVEVLLEHGAKVNLINKDNETALDLAIQLDETAIVQEPENTNAIVEMLKEHGAKTFKELKTGLKIK